MLRRLRQKFKLVDHFRALAVCGAQAVGARIAAAEDDHALALRSDGLLLVVTAAGDATVLLRQVLHCQVNALEIAARHGQLAGRARADGETYGVEVAVKVIGGEIVAHVDAGLEADTLRGHGVHAALHYLLLQLEVRDAEAQETANGLVALEECHEVAGAVELLSGGHAGRPGAG